MKTLKTIWTTILSVILITIITLNGFSQTGEKVKRGAGSGAAFGALAGLVFGNGNILEDAADGALRGAAFGAGAGLITGEMDKGRNRRAEKEREIAVQQNEEAIINQFGRDNVEAYYALVDQNHPRAIALANAGETSADVNHQLVSIWIQAMIAVDQNDWKSANKIFDQLIQMDPIIDTREQARIDTDKLVLEMRKERYS